MNKIIAVLLLASTLAQAGGYKQPNPTGGGTALPSPGQARTQVVPPPAPVAAPQSGGNGMGAALVTGTAVLLVWKWRF